MERVRVDTVWRDDDNDDILIFHKEKKIEFDYLQLSVKKEKMSILFIVNVDKEISIDQIDEAREE